MLIKAGVLLESKLVTFSFVLSPIAIDKICVALPVISKATLLGLFPSVTAEAFSCSVAILVLVFIAFAGSAPIDRDIDAFPASQRGPSNTVDRAFWILFSVRHLLSVVNFVGS